MLVKLVDNSVIDTILSWDGSKELIKYRKIEYEKT